MPTLRIGPPSFCGCYVLAGRKGGARKSEAYGWVRTLPPAGTAELGQWGLSITLSDSAQALRFMPALDLLSLFSVRRRGGNRGEACGAT
jgi:hypothetical protein